MSTFDDYRFLIIANCNGVQFYPLGEFAYCTASELDGALDSAAESCFQCMVWVEFVPPGMPVPGGKVLKMESEL